MVEVALFTSIVCSHSFAHCRELANLVRYTTAYCFYLFLTSFSLSTLRNFALFTICGLDNQFIHPLLYVVAIFRQCLAHCWSSRNRPIESNHRLQGRLWTERYVRHLGVSGAMLYSHFVGGQQLMSSHSGWTDSARH